MEVFKITNDPGKAIIKAEKAKLPVLDDNFNYYTD